MKIVRSGSMPISEPVLTVDAMDKERDEDSTCKWFGIHRIFEDKSYVGI